MYVIGFDIGGTKCAVILAQVNSDHIEFLERMVFPTSAPWQEMLEHLCVAGEHLLAGHCVPLDQCRIGISCGGPLDSDRGVILSPPNLPGWDEVPIKQLLEERFHLPVTLQNDADACALAEWRYGAGKGTRNMVFLTFGTGLGAGLILNGRLYRGACGMAGEAGHIRLADEGPTGYGKAGSFEGFCSGGGIAQLARTHAQELLNNGLRASYHQGELSQITSKAVAEAAREGHRDALEVLERSGDYFGRGLAVIIDLLNPEVIVAGSIFARSGEFLIPAMERSLEREALPASRAACRIVPACLGERIGDYGAVVAALGEEL